MSDPCLTSGTTPTVGPATTGPIGLFRSLLRVDQPESTKRMMALMAGGTLCFCLTILTLAVWYQALVYQKVDSQLVFALLGLSSSVAILAGAAYRKPEDAAGGAQ